MSVSFYASALIGVRFLASEFSAQEISSSCEHPEREGHRFCPECGTKVEDVIQEPEIDMGKVMEPFPEGFVGCVNDGFVYVGLGIYQMEILGEDVDSRDLTQLSAIAKSLRDHLGALYDPTTFRLWLLGNCSY